jgi:hypothetical protein
MSRSRVNSGTARQSDGSPRAALAGTYAGATAGATVGATVGAGAGVNVLVGGSDRTVTLQPISVQAQTGMNIAAGVSTMELRPATVPYVAGNNTRRDGHGYDGAADSRDRGR